MSAEQIRTSEDLKGRCMAYNESARLRLIEFGDFCRANGKDPSDDESVVAYVVALAGDGLGLRTIRNYKNLVVNGRRGMSILSGLDSQIHRAILRAPRRHALDLTEEQIVNGLLPLLSSVNKRVSAIAVCMAWTGLRYADLCYLPRKYIRIRPGKAEGTAGIVVDIREAKQIKKDILRKRLVIPDDLVVATAVCQDLLDWYAGAAAMDTLGVGEVTAFNRYLQRFDTGAERHATSYSLRRYAMNRFIDRCTDAEGIIDWDRAVRYSLHFKSETLEAFYHGDLDDE